MQAAFLQQVEAKIEALPPAMITKLGSLRFVPVAGGSEYGQPSNVLDPRSPLGSLLDPSSARITSVTTTAEREIIDSLSRLGLFITCITPAIASECIALISVSADIQLANRLFPLVNDPKFDASSFKFDRTVRWIPCEDGHLYTASECRDDNNRKQQQRALFDRVLSVTSTPVVSTSLRSCLNWHSEVPISLLKRQFLACVMEDPVPVATLQALVQALASRHIEDDDLSDLRAASTDRQWVPVENDECSVTAFAVLYLDGPLPPFRKVQFQTKTVRTFLTGMGCAERPSSETILETLQKMYTSKELLDPNHARSLLEAIDITSLDSQTIAQLPVPTDVGGLHICSQTYYNDLGTKASFVHLPDEARRTHEGISLGLARKLALKDLSSLQFKDEDEDMEEALATRISNALRGYNQDQMPTEYLANAIDAGASSVSFLVDEVDFSTARDRIITPSLAQFQDAGALVIHNDAVFSDSDWKGIRSVGRGSKRDQSGKIGRFGLGALAAYHFSEVTMIVSGSYFLFLDPSRHFLGKRASRRVTLRDMHVFYPDQLAPFIGLFGFELNTDSYAGTIFRLPLRSIMQGKTSDLSKNVMNVHTARQFFEKQETRARLAIIFNSRLISVEAGVRSLGQSGRLEVSSIWQIAATRETIDSYDSTLPSAIHAEVVISSFKGISRLTEAWRTGLYALSSTDMPPSFRGVSERYLLPDTLSVGVALPRSARTSSQACSLFSHLPLPIETTLPFHVHASFILAEDRRSIRLDDNSITNPESSYNRRLLAEVPNLYLSVLHHWPVTAEPGDSLASARFWPSHHDDEVSRIITDTLYAIVGADSRMVCEDVTGARIAPSAAMFIGSSVPAGVIQSIELLRPSSVVTTPTATDHIPSTQRVDASTALQFVSHSSDQLGELYDKEQMSIAQLLELSRWLSGDDKHGSRLDGLRLLPLADGSLVRFRTDPLPSPRDSLFMPSKASVSACLKLFPPSRFVHPDACEFLRGALPNSTLQVQRYSDAALTHFVRTRLRPSHTAVLSEDDATWVHTLWATFSFLYSSRELPQEIYDRPLVPVHGQRHRHVSLASCCGVGASTLLRTTSAPAALTNALSAMGASFVEKSQLPTSLGTREPIKPMTFSLSSILRFYEFHRRDHAKDMNSVQAANLREWIRAQIKSGQTLSPDDLRIALTFPLFCVRDGPGFAAASNVRILPKDVRIQDVVPLTLASDRLVPHDEALVKALQITPMTYSDLGQSLASARRPGQIISNAQLSALSHLLQTVLANQTAIREMQNALQVPNTRGVYVRPRSLYSRRVPMFVSIFDADGRQPDVFLDASLSRSFDPALEEFQLCTKETAPAFEQCALLVQEVTDTQKIASARIVYRCYSERLPFVREARWPRYDAIQFIPRANVRRRDTPTLDAYARALPEVVSPRQLLRAEFSGVAWTQRALFEEEPSPRVLAEHPALGVPTIEEVVAHIRVLSTVPRDHEDRTVVAKDVKASYKFLQDRLSDMNPAVRLQLKRGNFFLNIESALTEWTWCSTADLILEASYDGPNYKMVRSSLKSASKLLRALGVPSVLSVDKPDIRTTTSEGALLKLRGSFDKKRRAEIAIDVVFIDADDRPGRHPAHKIFLAAWSSYFEDQFYASGMRESVLSMDFEPLEITVHASGGAARRCLDWMYTGVFTTVGHDDLQILLDMLGLADYWRVDDLKSTVQTELVVHITPGEYRAIREYADRYSASILLRKCIEWEEKNRDILRRGVDMDVD